DLVDWSTHCSAECLLHGLPSGLIWQPYAGIGHRSRETSDLPARHRVGAHIPPDGVSVLVSKRGRGIPPPDDHGAPIEVRQSRDCRDCRAAVHVVGISMPGTWPACAFAL